MGFYLLVHIWVEVFCTTGGTKGSPETFSLEVELYSFSLDEPKKVQINESYWSRPFSAQILVVWAHFGSHKDLLSGSIFPF